MEESKRAGKGFFEAMSLPICQVETYLYIGNKPGARNRALLHEHNIKRVVQIQDTETRPFFPGQFKYLTFDVFDESFGNISAVLPLALPFISQGIEMQESVFVHCDAGSSRSGAVIVAYLMASRGLSYVEGLKQARDARACIAPNTGFRQQITDIPAEELRGYLRNYSVLEDSLRRGGEKVE